MANGGRGREAGGHKDLDFFNFMSVFVNVGKIVSLRVCAPPPPAHTHIIKNMITKGDQNDFMFLTIFLIYAFAIAFILYVCPLVESFKRTIILGPVGESECFL